MTVDPKIRKKPGPKIPLLKEEVEAYIIDANGCFADAARMVEEDTGIPMTRQKFCYWIDALDADWYPKRLLKDIAKACIDVTYKKALEQKDNQCLFKLIDKLGKYLNIEDPVQKTESVIHHDLNNAFHEYDGRDLKKARESY